MPLTCFPPVSPLCKIPFAPQDCFPRFPPFPLLKIFSSLSRPKITLQRFVPRFSSLRSFPTFPLPLRSFPPSPTYKIFPPLSTPTFPPPSPPMIFSWSEHGWRMVGARSAAWREQPDAGKQPSGLGLRPGHVRWPDRPAPGTRLRNLHVAPAFHPFPFRNLFPSMFHKLSKCTFHHFPASVHQFSIIHVPSIWPPLPSFP